jgi:hypothetical protein
MLDFSHIPTPFGGATDRQVFIGTMSTATGLSQTWVKPRGVSMVHILMLGAGGKGAAATAGATSAGGAGGGSGAQSSLLIPAHCLPDICFVGGGSGGSGTAVNSFFAARPHGATAASPPVASDIFLIAGGAIGNAVTVGATGTAATAILSGHGQAVFLAGIAGGAAGAATGAVGATVAAQTTGLFVSGGGGGAGMSAAAAFAGGPSTTSFPSFLPTSLGGTAGTSGVAGGAGQSGISLMDGRFMFSGGGGGGTGFPVATASAGGNGGSGGYGCGGGGGGGAVTGQVAGLGGAGGSALIIVTAW